MSDFSQGPGWWQASDGKWYPPEQAPGAAPGGMPPMPQAQPAYGAPAAGGELASWGDRAIAYLADVAIIFVAYIAIIIVGSILGAIADALGALVMLVGWLAMIGYSFYIFFVQGESGATPGKRLTGLKVVGEATGQPIGGGMGIVRQFAHILDSLVCYIGWFLPLFDEKKQTIADKVMKTLVLKNQPKVAPGPDLFKR